MNLDPRILESQKLAMLVEAVLFIAVFASLAAIILWEPAAHAVGFVMDANGNLVVAR